MDPVRWILWISLLLEADAYRYCLTLAGSSFDRVIERYYLTLTRTEAFCLVTKID